jgi:hypothetical protein
MLVALDILVRPTALALPILLGIIGAFVNRPTWGTDRSRWPMPIGLTFLIMIAIVLLPWQLRNYRALGGQWVWTTTNEGVTRYDGFNPDATGGSDQDFIKPMRERLSAMNEVARSRYLSNLADEFIAAHPRQSVELMMNKMARTWSPVPLSPAMREHVLYVVAGLVFSLPLDLMVLVGFAGTFLTRSAKTLLLTPAIYLTLLDSLSVGSLRYRMPAEPFLAILAAAGVAAIAGQAGTRHRAELIESPEAHS